jgi:hypothetical protein
VERLWRREGRSAPLLKDSNVKGGSCIIMGVKRKQKKGSFGKGERKT